MLYLLTSLLQPSPCSFIFSLGEVHGQEGHCFSSPVWTAFSQLVAYELPGIGAAGNTAEQLMHGTETWEKPFLPLFVETLGHELCEILKLRIWYDEMSICTCTCYHYECPEATHSVENEDFCPQLTLPFNVQAEEFKSLGVGFNFILWDQGEDLWYTEYL